MKTRNWLQLLIPILVLVALTAAISAPVYYQRLRTPTTDDYDAHITFTLRMLKRDLPPTFVLAHPLLELMIGFLYWAGRGHVDIFDAEAFILVATQCAAALAIYFWIGKLPGWRGEAKRIAAAATLTMVAPIMLFAPLDGLFYFGYIGLASYHNPTTHLLRPFAIISFIFTLRAFTHPRSPAWMVLLSAALLLGGALAKPSYAMSILPVIGIGAAWALWRRKPLDWPLLILGNALPALLSLALQTFVVYLVADADASGIVIRPFAVEAAYSNYIPLKYLLSIAFPLGALIFFWRRYRGELSMLLAWLAFISGTLQVYLLAETGDRFLHGNFRWSAQITLFLLFIATARFLLKHEDELPKTQRLIAWGIYLLHIAGGIAYYIYAYIQPNYG